MKRICSFIVLAVSVFFAHAESTRGIREVSVSVLFDTSDLRAETEALRAVRNASNIFEREFEIRLVVQRKIDWRPTHVSRAGVNRKPEFARIEHMRRETDLVIAFTRLSLYDRHFGIFYPRLARVGGFGSPSGNILMVLDEKAGPTLAHELGHVFGSEHSKDKHSLMFTRVRKSKVFPNAFDSKNRDIILANRGRTF